MGQAVYYTTMTFCVFGCVSRILLAGYYRLQLRALKSMRTTKNKGMRQLKEKFILRYQAMLGVQNVEKFVGRFLAEQRILWIPISTWNGLQMQMVSACLLMGAMDALYCCVQGGDTRMILTAMFQGIWTGSMLLLVDGFCMIPAKAEALKEGMCDYLENYLKVRLEHEYEVWGKNREELRQTGPVLNAQLRVTDEPEFFRAQRKERKRKRQQESKVQKDVVMLKAEVAERRKRDAEAAVTAEEEKQKKAEKRVNRQLDTLLAELSLHA